MPRLSDSMEEGTILRWLKSDGEAVEPGDELAEIETDKTRTTFAAETAGVLRVVAKAGDTVAVGGVIATIGDGAGNGARPAPVVTETGTKKGDVRVEELTRTQQVLARRVAESKATVPDFWLSTDVDMDRCADLRAQLRAIADPAPTYNDIVVKAAALALRESPRANGAYRDGRFELYSRVNVGIAVAGQDSLVVPTIFDADRKELAEIAREARRLAERVRAGAITPPDLSGATFTVSNLGMYGVTEFSAVINPPQAGLLAVGAVREVPVVRDGAIVPGRRMRLTLVCDHRILYGAGAARFLGRIRALLEQPLALTR